VRRDRGRDRRPQTEFDVSKLDVSARLDPVPAVTRLPSGLSSSLGRQGQSGGLYVVVRVSSTCICANSNKKNVMQALSSHRVYIRCTLLASLLLPASGVRVGDAQLQGGRDLTH
jgi:hypothetical protein